ncbi:MAG: C10 family peptidase [Prevotellaceae bacterium]|nr:C10 family peptidase [Prevotellaceae bacterium]
MKNVYITQTNITKDNSNVLLYEVVFDNKKSVLLSGNKNCRPVIGHFDNFSGSVLLDTDNIPCGLKSMVYGFKMEIKSRFDKPQSKDFFITEWNNLISDDVSQKNIQQLPAATIIGPLITASWGQDLSNDGGCEAYNYYVPQEKSGCDCGKCTVGCGAVAMGQIMNYWKYPQQFDWCNMSDELETSSPNYIKERNAVAGLLYDCAKEMHTFFCISNCESSATVTNIRNAFTDYGYNANYESRAFSHVKQQLIDNINAYHPVLYNGFSWFDNAHTFVVDGYNSSTDKFHFNFGWRDNITSINNWFSLSALDEEEYNYNIQTAVVDIYPSSSFDFCNYNVTVPSILFNPLKNVIPQYYLTTLTIGGGNGTAVINSGEHLSYKAHQAIYLKPGFQAKSGSTFRAYIEPCANCTQPQPAPPAFANNMPPDVDYQQESGEAADFGNGQISIYPNPTAGIVNIASNSMEIRSIDVFDISGKILKSNVDFAENILNLSYLSNGIYFIKIQTLSEQTTHKIIIQK